MIVDIGGGTHRGGRDLARRHRREPVDPRGGDELDEAIINYAKREYKLLMASRRPRRSSLRSVRLGRWRRSSRRRSAAATWSPVSRRPSAHQRGGAAARSTSPSRRFWAPCARRSTARRRNWRPDIMDRGIMLAGGGALLHGLDERLRQETQMPAHLAESPLTCVAVGSGRRSRSSRSSTALTAPRAAAPSPLLARRARPHPASSP